MHATSRKHGYEVGTLRLEDEQEKANARSEDFHIPYKGRLRIVEGWIDKRSATAGSAPIAEG